MCFLTFLGPKCWQEGVKFRRCPSAWPSTSGPPRVFGHPGLTPFSFTLSTVGTLLLFSGSQGIVPLSPVCSGHALPCLGKPSLCLQSPTLCSARPSLEGSSLLPWDVHSPTPCHPASGLSSSLPCPVWILRACHCPSMIAWTPCILYTLSLSSSYHELWLGDLTHHESPACRTGSSDLTWVPHKANWADRSLLTCHETGVWRNRWLT